MTTLAITLIGPDRPGLVSLLAQTAAEHEANWLESHLASLVGQFAGIVHLDVPDARCESLRQALLALSTRQLQVTVVEAGVQDSNTVAGTTEAAAWRAVGLELIGQDHPGIVRDITSTLAQLQVSVDEMQTHSLSAPGSGEILFKAGLQLQVPQTVSIETLNAALEQISNDLMVDVTLEVDP